MSNDIALCRGAGCKMRKWCKRYQPDSEIDWYITGIPFYEEDGQWHCAYYVPKERCGTNNR